MYFYAKRHQLFTSKGAWMEVNMAKAVRGEARRGVIFKFKQGRAAQVKPFGSDDDIPLGAEDIELESLLLTLRERLMEKRRRGLLQVDTDGDSFTLRVEH
jgi:hypothetical protein